MKTVPFRRSSFCGENGCVEVAVVSGDTILLRDGKKPDLPGHEFSIEEWEAFLAGVKVGEFDYSSLTGQPSSSISSRQD